MARNIPRLLGDNAGMITVHLFAHRWFWVIQLPDDVTSVGVVGRQALFKSRDISLDALFSRAVSTCSSLAKPMANAEPIGSLLACADYSYDAEKYVGENHILIGDAAAFIDPRFSSGVMMAMSSATFGATVVEACLDGSKPCAQLIRDYEAKIRLSLTSLFWPVSGSITRSCATL